jgi:hypothetical protein
VVDPCLTTWEAKELVSWLVHAAHGQAGMVTRFSEPNLTMTARASAPARVEVRACFALELRPPWAHTAAGSDNLCVDLDVDGNDLVRAAASLLADLVAFPQRGDDPTL